MQVVQYASVIVHHRQDGQLRANVIQDIKAGIKFVFTGVQENTTLCTFNHTDHIEHVIC